MSIFSKMSGADDGKKAKGERFFGVVKSIDVPNAVMDVVDVESGEARKVALDQEAKITLGEGRVRPGIADFTKGKMKTEVGGTVRVEDALYDKASDTWKARWISSAVHSPEDGAVLVVKAGRVGALVARDGHPPYRALDILAGSAAPVTSADELRLALTNAIQSEGNAFLRFTDGKTESHIHTAVGGRADAPVTERIDRVLSDATTAKWMAAIDAHGKTEGFQFEVIPVKRIYFGADSASKAALDKLFTRIVSDASGNATTVAKGFGELLVTLQNREDGSQFVTGAITKVAFGPLDRMGGTVGSSAAFVQADVTEDAAPDLGDVDLDAMFADVQESAAPQARHASPGM